MTPSEPMATMAPDGVNLINEDEAGCVLLSLLEHIADPRCTHTDEHLDEVRSTNGEERNVGLTRDRSRNQRLASSRSVLP